MTSPRKKDVFAVEPVSKANWLGRYLPIEIKAVKEIETALKDAERSIAKTLAASANIEEPNISTGIRRAQLNLDMRAVRKTLTEVFGSVTNIVRDHQTEAALAAVDAGFFDDRNVMSKLFPNPIDRQNFTESFKRTAERNVQAMMTRILKTQQPLSKRVWHTRALSQGYVDRAVNNALARGDSYKDLAKSVKHLVNPDTPGGISYAAKRLARTEINNAFHAQSISDVQEKPWVDSASWNLSKRHVEDPGDLCEVYALQIHFPKTQVPKKPHPHCRCFITPDLMDYDAFEDALVTGQFDPYLDNVLGGKPEEKIARTLTRQEERFPSPPAPKEPEIEFYQLPDLPIFDINSATSPDEVARIMGEKYPHISFLNWNKKNTTLEAAKQYAQGLDEMLTTFPDNGLDVVSFGTNPEIEYGRTYMAPNGRSLIIFNKHYSLDPKYTYEKMKYDVHTNFHVKKSDEKPYYQTAIHEFGHVLDAYTGLQARKSAVKDLALKLSETDYDVTPEGFLKWFHDNMVDYGFNDDGSINFLESTAESFADVMLNGDEASPISQILTKHLLSSEPTGVKSSFLMAQSGSRTLTRERLFTDIDSAPTPEAVAYALELRHPGLKALKFNDRNVTLDAAKEVAHGIDDMMNKYPNSGLKEIIFTENLDNSVYARTIMESGFKSTIEFNSHFGRNPDLARERMIKNEIAGFHPANTGAQPYYSLITHEFGHVLDNDGHLRAEGNALERIMNFYSEYIEPEPIRPTNTGQPNYLHFIYLPWREKLRKWENRVIEWLRGDPYQPGKPFVGAAPSRYSLKDSPFVSLNHAEALAEAFLDVEANGNNAKDTSKVLHALLLKVREETIGKQ